GESPIDQSMPDSIVLQGNVHPLARPEFDVGATDPSLPMEQIILILKQGWEKQAQLDSLLTELHDSTSYNYHHWVTPEEFGERFGQAPDNIDVITRWLTSQGFIVEKVAKGRTWIIFSGT